MGFPEGFMWGGASSAYQIEGAYKADGKGLNVWDVYTHQPGHVKHFENGDVACDHYNKYKEDVALFKELGIKCYRFSINWPRILPNGVGEVNEAGIKFYSDLIDELIKAGIEPVVSLYHWEYPHELFKKGAWLNPESPLWFEEYVKVVVDAFSDRVKYWMTINEPQCVVGCDYMTGSHAPFMKHERCDLILMVHNVLLSHGRAVKYIREHAKQPGKIGIVPTAPVFVPKDNSKEAIEEARAKTFDMRNAGLFSVSLWSDPIFLGKYPEECKEFFGDSMITPSKEDMDLISQELDFYSCTIYYSSSTPVPDNVQYKENEYQGDPRTTINWVVHEDVMYWMCKFMYERYKKPIFVAENGMANMDWVSLDGKVHDPQRIDFTHRYLLQMKKAIDEGVPALGYIHWSVMDNFEWAHGYSQRFGLIYVDYATQKRTIKDSGYWYREVIENNGGNL
ncbi:MAG: GH1 family beta-glucosidase [Saccharofermentans sp.]|nr:GH1 family beta-glucosidase [Saccharofermentans sp.]